MDNKEHLVFTKINEVYLKVECEKHIAQELSEFFTFFVPGHQFVPAFRNRIWDGKIRLFDLRNNQFYIGLLPYLEEFCVARDYEYSHDFIDDEFSVYHANKFFDSLNLHSRNKIIEVRDHQRDAFVYAMRHRRTLLLSPTASGKSLIIYLLFRQLLDYQNLKGLIIVPTTSLVSQLYSDFEDYSSETDFDVDSHVHYVFQGRDKVSEKKLIISTWQSIYKMPKEYFEQFDYVIGDECLHPDTLIEMENGTKKIKDIDVGDLVKTFNEKTKKIELKPVLKIHKNISINEKYYEVTLSNGKKIKITGNHKVLLENGIWTRVDNLKNGDIINSIEQNKMVKKMIYVTDIKEIEKPNEVYNLHVKDNHNYFAEKINVSNCHLFKAQSLQYIMSSLINTKYRIGLTGTLDGTKTHKLVLEGVFGKVKQVTTTKELIDKNQLSPFTIKCIILKHSDESCKLVSEMTYQEEIEYLILNEQRNKFIKNLAISLEKNTLVLFQLVDKHGKNLYNIIKSSEKIGNRKVFFVHGGTDTDDRENIRKIMENENDAIVVASFGTFSTGINVRNLHNIIFASPSKSRIRNLQSIGRGLRQSEGKEIATLYDISDDLRHHKYMNYTLRHFTERVKIYNEEKFPFKIYKIGLKK